MCARLSTKCWDLTRERHLDLDKPLADGVALAEWFAQKAIIVLDNEIDAPTADDPRATTFPHRFLAPDQARRAAAGGLDVAFIGTGFDLRRWLMPTNATPDATHDVFRRYLVRFWAKPDEDWLRRQAFKLAKRLANEHPEQRHVVVFRFAPAVQDGSRFTNHWKVGTLETHRTLDRAAGAIVQADVPARDRIAYPSTEIAERAVLSLFGFGENLVRYQRALAVPEPDPIALARIVDALIVDLSTELAVALEGAPTPRLDALAGAELGTSYDSAGRASVIRLAGRVQFLAGSHVSWWEKVPPFRWLRRSPGVRGQVDRAIERLLARTFGEHDLQTVTEEVRGIVETLRDEHRRAKQSGLAGKRRAWAREQMLLPIAPTAITTDTELLGEYEERVLSEAEYEALVAERAASEQLRRALVANAERDHDDLAL